MASIPLVPIFFPHSKDSTFDCD